ncbi:TetR/AcrR family transcriptional regulator [Streptomyces sp. NPDC091290]|uniref:TetR/AcrR family transcriptional regulator n=1 Tax=Streptomyces sp. NPDC091290 TaxID=3365990 RepID=UPI0038145900
MMTSSPTDISRSTLLRRLGGGRRVLDDAVRAAVVDPGGQKPVRERAIEAGAALISSQGLASVSLERVASPAQCSVHSLYAGFGGRDEMLQAIFLRYSPIVDVEEVVANQPTDLDSTIRAICVLMAAAIGREPRGMPAILAELLARPQGDSLQPIVRSIYPRLFDGVGKWLSSEISAGRIRDLRRSCSCSR